MKELGCTVHIETSGAYPMSGQLDWITLSPKKTGLPKDEIYQKANELKMIVFNNHDLPLPKSRLQKFLKTADFIFRASGVKEMKCILRLQILSWNTRSGRLQFRPINI
jgi:organic radical activating enzyme